MSGLNTSTLSEQQEPLIEENNTNTSFNILISDAFKVIFLAIPKCLENLFYIWFPFFIVTVYAGHLSVEALAIASLGTSIYKGTMRIIFRGLGISGATIFGQAYGHGKYKLLGLMLQRIIIIGFGFVLLSCILYIPMEYILKAMGQGDLSATTAFYLQCLIPFAFFDAIFWSVSVYLQAQKIAMLQSAIAFMGIAVESFSLWIFIDILKLDWKGLSIGYGTSILFCGTCMIMVLLWWHRKMKGDVRDPWVDGFSKKSFQELRPIIVLIFYGFILNFFVSAANEFLTIVSGLLENPELYVGAIGILSNILNFGSSIIVGLSFSGGILIATEVGKGDKKGIKFIIYVVFALYIAITTIIVIFLLSVKDIIGSWWTKDINIQKEIADCLIYICLFIISNMVTNFCTCIMVGVRRQRTLFFITLIVVVIFGIPLPLLMCFVFEYGFKGLLIGYMISGFVNAISSLIMTFTVNWDKEIINAKQRHTLLEESLNRSRASVRA